MWFRSHSFAQRGCATDECFLANGNALTIALPHRRGVAVEDGIYWRNQKQIFETTDVYLKGVLARVADEFLPYLIGNTNPHGICDF